MSSPRIVRGWSGALMAIACLIAFAAPAAGQDLNVDANIFWNNTVTYSGDSGGAACWHGTITVTQLATSIFHNQTLNPLLTDPTNFTAPDWSPMGGSPALNDNPNFRVVGIWDEDPWFTPVCYAGAAGYGDRWWEGWTYFNVSGGAGRTDIPAGAPIDVYGVTSDTTWTTGSKIRLNGRVAIFANRTLTIQAGVVVIGAAQGSFLVAERDGNLVVDGTPQQPVIFTSGAAPGSQIAGDWGGVVIHGKARANCGAVAGCALTELGNDCESEGGSGFFGGADDGDDSGSLRYARVEYAGYIIANNNELNSWTFNAVGSGTEIEYLQSHAGLDDGFEFFGGTAQLKHIVSTAGGDDNFDWQMGYRGRVQFMLIQLANQAGEDCGIEADNNEYDEQCPLRSDPIVSNMTAIDFPGVGSGYGARLRRGTAGVVVNSIFQGFPTGLRVEASSLNQCASRTVIPDADCGSLQLGVPGDGGIRPGIVAMAAPNPTRGPATISFSLEKPGKATVQIFDLGGRLVDTLVDGRLPAGRQELRWNGASASGVYFYRVTTDEGKATGKLMVTR